MTYVQGKRGRGLLPSTIDILAETASSRVYASIPNNDQDLSQGFRDINYSEFANAINHAAHWLDNVLGQVGKDEGFPTFSYEGPKDLRFPILTVAAIKTHRTVSCIVIFVADAGIDHERRCLFYRLWPRSKGAPIFSM